LGIVHVAMAAAHTIKQMSPTRTHTDSNLPLVGWLASYSLLVIDRKKGAKNVQKMT